ERVIFTARFGRTLSTLYMCGMPIVSALKLAKDTIGNKYIEKQFDTAVSLIRAGENLSNALMTIDGFTKKLSASVRVGEETGHLDTMLTALSDDLDYESEMATDRILAYLEPAMIVVMAGIVGFIMIAIIQPIYGSYGAIGGGMM
ncbi:MAG: type II secretion system F family protein, partial [Lachnospiraceae bacterium]|nr:type II secretion system F family protein [Lachnospiraceae bacterium]